MRKKMKIAAGNNSLSRINPASRAILRDRHGLKSIRESRTKGSTWQ